MSNRTESTTNEMSEHECRALLRETHVGRVAYVIDGAPMLMPVDFAVVEDLIAFRSDPGSKVDRMPLTKVCFEADGRIGSDVWSVIVQGHARDVTTALGTQLAQLRAERIPSSASLQDSHWLVIEIEQITGRRLVR